MELYTKGSCTYCTKAKAFLDEKKIKYIVHTMDPDAADYSAERQKLIDRTGQTTFPWIFVGETFVGGYTELVRAYDTFYLETLGIDLSRDDF